ncbi:MAG: N-acetylmuramoyl-L-alanine amidase [Proteobacteria bacterium]|nr:N-acetylmuramoyl-L-alanine amidase [Pseudomonadota bacterium]
MRNIKKHIIHCSDSITGDVESLRRFHKSKGWRDIGYHFVIRQDGVIEIGRPLDKMGAHCRKHNKFSIGTCLIGRSVFTDKQFESLKSLQKTLKVLFPEIEIIEHNKLNPNKTCPNFKL